MRKISNKKADDALKIQSVIRETLIQIASEGRRQVNIQPTSPAYVSDLKTAVNEIAAGVAGYSNSNKNVDVVRLVPVSRRKKRERINVKH
jgi:hypothetical protein